MGASWPRQCERSVGVENLQELKLFVFLPAGLGTLTIVQYAVNEHSSKTTKRMIENHRNENGPLIGYKFIKPLSQQIFYRRAKTACFWKVTVSK